MLLRFFCRYFTKMFANNTIHEQNEEMKLKAMQRVWLLNRRQSSALSVFEESPELDLFPTTQVNYSSSLIAIPRTS